MNITLSSRAAGDITTINSDVAVYLDNTAAAIMYVNLTPTNQYVYLPDATTLDIGKSYTIVNVATTTSPFVADRTGATLGAGAISYYDYYTCVLTDNSSIAGSWTISTGSLKSDAPLSYPNTLDNLGYTPSDASLPAHYYTQNVAALSSTSVLGILRKYGDTRLYSSVYTVSDSDVIGSNLQDLNIDVYSATGYPSTWSTVPLSSTKVFMAYSAVSTGYAYGVILDISGSTVTVGTPTALNSDAVSSISGAVLSSTQVIVTYRNDSSTYVNAVIADISGSTVTAGTPAVVNTGNDTSNVVLSALSSTKAICAWRNTSTGYVNLAVLDVSGSTITPGTVTAALTGCTPTDLCKISSTQAALAYYTAVTAGATVSISVSGTTITVGTSSGSVASAVFKLTLIDSTTLLAVSVVSNMYTAIITISGTTFTLSASTTYGSTTGGGTDYIRIAACTSTRIYVSLGLISNYVLGGGIVLVINNYRSTWATQAIIVSSAATALCMTGMSSTQSLVIYRTGTALSVRTLNVSGTTVTFGTAVGVGISGSLPAITKLSSTQAICIFKDDNSGGISAAATLNISGTDVTVGSLCNVTVSGISTTVSPTITALSSTKAMAVYADSQNYLNAVVLSVSGTTVTAGSIQSVTSASSSVPSITTLSSTKAICSYADTSNLIAKVVVLNESSTNVSVATAYTLNEYYLTTSVTRTNVCGMNSTQAIVSAWVSGSIFTQVLTVGSGDAIVGGPPLYIRQSSITSVQALTAIDSTRAALVFRSSISTTLAVLTLVNTDSLIGSLPAGSTGMGNITYIDVAALSTTSLLLTAVGTSNYPRTQVVTLSTGPAFSRVYQLGAYPGLSTASASLSSSKALVVHADGDTIPQVRACTVNRSGTTISHGDVTVMSTIVPYISSYNPGNTASQFINGINANIELTALSSTSAVCLYQNTSNRGLSAAVMSISGDTVASYSPLSVTSVPTSNFSIAPLTSTQAICIYSLDTSGTCEAVILNVSGASVTKGTPVSIASNVGCVGIDALGSNAAICVYNELGWAGYSVAVRVSVSGSTITVNTSSYLAQVTYGVSVTALSSTRAIVALSFNNSLGAYALDISSSAITPSTMFSRSNTSGYYKSRVKKVTSELALVLYGSYAYSIYTPDINTMTISTSIVCASYVTNSASAAAISANSCLLVSQGNDSASNWNVFARNVWPNVSSMTGT